MRKAAKLPLDFTHRIRYNKSRSKICAGVSEWQTRGTQNPLRGFVRSFQNSTKSCWIFEFSGDGFCCIPPEHPSNLLKPVRKSKTEYQPMWRNGRRKRLKIARETMWVRVPPSAPSKQSGLFQVPGCFIFVANHTFVFSGKMLTMALAEDTLLEKSRWV